MKPLERRSAVLEKSVKLLPSPMRQLLGKRASPAPQADNLVCFCRLTATDLNRPQRGRALHHRCVLIMALRTTVTVCIDDRAIPLHAGEGILVLPFQFHDYIQPEKEDLVWLFMTFDLPDVVSLEPLRFRPFTLTPEIMHLAHETVRSFLTPRQDDLTVTIFRHLLARIRMVDPIEREATPTAGSPNILGQVNEMVQRAGAPPTAKEIAARIGISESHLRAKFRESCGVSLGRHLRRLRMEKACGLLRMSTSRISEIGELCGFSSVFSFSRTFHLTYGVSPRAYRQGGKTAGHLADHDSD